MMSSPRAYLANMAHLANLVLGFYLGMIGWVAPLLAHPNHDVIAEADWNAEGKSLEVALQVNAHELERAVSLVAGEALDLDDDASLDHLRRYIATNVRCLKPGGSAVAMRWVGAEIKVRSAWLYFEFPLADSGVAITDCVLTNTVFFDRYDDQKNTIALRLQAGQPRRFMRFSSDRKRLHVQPPEAGDSAVDKSLLEPAKETPNR